MRRSRRRVGWWEFSAVGRNRARYLVVLTGATHGDPSPHPPVATVHATFTAHGDPRRGPLRRLGSADLSETSPALTPYGASSVDGYFAHLSRCGPSPCTWLSHAP